MAGGGFVAFDVCPAGRVLNALAAKAGQVFDEGGMLAAGGNIDEGLLQQLDALPYYSMDYPKSLANEFGTETVLPMLQGLSVADGLRTYVEHIVHQVERAVRELALDAEEERMGAGGAGAANPGSPNAVLRLLVTGGGAHNTFLIGRLREALSALGVELVIPGDQLINYKEALIMALIGVLRWREESNVLASVTGAGRDSIGGAVWIGQEG
jgi:anhydro-N-acetylmuramic acid kinase